MNRNMKSILGGAAVAAFVISPSVSGFSQTNGTQAVAALDAPPPPPLPPAPHMPAISPAPSHNPDWTTAPARNFNTTSLKLDDVVGNVIIAVRDRGPMTLVVAGAPQRVNAVRATAEDGKLVVDASPNYEDDRSVWDWRNWFNFSDVADRQSGNLTITATVPRGSAVAISDLVGDATVGDTMGDLRLEAAATKAHIGKVAKASIAMGGSGQIDIASVAGKLDLDLGGSGKVVVGSTGSVKADIAGSGDAQLGTIAGGLSLDIAGSGDVTAAHVNGPVHVDIAGSGNVHIADGIANPLHLDIMGAGNFWFGGIAIDPHIDAVGSGSVRIKAYRGHLDSEGMADVKIGD